MASKVIKDKVNTDTSLNDRQRQFCVEYLIDLNATQAYIRAYGEDVDPNSARAMSCKLLTNISIKKYMNDLIDSYGENCDITVAEIVNGLKDIILDPNARHADKIKCYDLLAKYKGMLIDHKDITVTSTEVKLSKSEIDKQLEELGYNRPEVVRIIDNI